MWYRSEGYSGGHQDKERDEYLLFADGFVQWTNVGHMKRRKNWNTSVLVNGCLFTTGGFKRKYSLHEKFSFQKGVKHKKEMPIALEGHTATILSKHKYLICGGVDRKVIKTFQIKESKKI